MKSKDTISKGPKRRDETCYQVLQDIVIPAGTILRANGSGKFEADVGLIGQFTITIGPGDIHSHYRKVVA